MGPYRTSTRETLPRAHDTKTWNALPLGVIGATFTMPFTTDCGTRTLSPMSECHGAMGAWIAPTFLVAAMLCASLVHTMVTKSYARWLTLGAGAIIAASGVVLSIIAIADAPKKPITLVWGLPSMAAVALFVLACKSGGSRRLGLVLDAYVLSSLPFAVLATMTAERYGAFLFSGAFASVLVARALAFVARHTKRKGAADFSTAPSPH